MLIICCWNKGFLCGSVVKYPATNTGDTGDEDLFAGSGRSPRGGNGNHLHYSCLENPIDRKAWRGAVCVAANSHTRRSNRACPCAGIKLLRFYWNQLFLIFDMNYWICILTRLALFHLSWGQKSLQMVTEAMKLKDTYPLEAKLWKT